MLHVRPATAAEVRLMLESRAALRLSEDGGRVNLPESPNCTKLALMDGDTLCGLAVLTQRASSLAECHVLMLPSGYGPKGLVLGRLALRHFYRVTKCGWVSALIPASNKLAVRYARKLGFLRVGVLAGAWNEGQEDLVHMGIDLREDSDGCCCF